jgi:hypothetical protein
MTLRRGHCGAVGALGINVVPGLESALAGSGLCPCSLVALEKCQPYIITSATPAHRDNHNSVTRTAQPGACRAMVHEVHLLHSI